MAATIAKQNDHDHKYILICCIHISRCNFRVYCKCRVLVLPGIFPAIIAVAPNSPSPLANASTPPEMIPGSAFGIITRKEKCSTHSFQVFLPQRSDLHQSVPGHLLQNGTSMEMTSQLPQGSLRPHEKCNLNPKIIFK